MFANVNGVKQFGIILPTPPGQEPLVLFFLGLLMGWVLLPPVFCAVSETVADRTNTALKVSLTRRRRQRARRPGWAPRHASG